MGIQLLADGPSVALVWRGVAWVADVWVRLEVVCGGGMLDNGLVVCGKPYIHA